MDYNRNPQILDVVPKNNQTDVPTSLSAIQVFFDSDLDQDHLLGNFILEADNVPVPCAIAYANRTVTMRPNNPLKPNVTYSITVVGSNDPTIIKGVRNVFGKPLNGYAQTIFSTVSADTFAAPRVISPIDQSVTTVKPALSWEAVTGATAYRVQLSASNTMFPLLWPASDDLIHVVSVDPDVTLIDGNYYWRVRAIGINGKEGDWTDIQQFRISSTSQAPAAPGDTLPPQISYSPFTPDPEVLEAFPAHDAANMSTKLKSIYYRVLGTVKVEDISIEMFGESITGEDSIPSHDSVSGMIEVLPQGDGTTLIVFTPNVLPSS